MKSLRSPLRRLRMTSAVRWFLDKQGASSLKVAAEPSQGLPLEFFLTLMEEEKR